MVVLEAMAHGLPVVLSSEHHCGVSGLLTHELNALILSDPTDPHALANALGRLLGEPLLHQTLVAAGLTFASDHQWSTIALKQDETYHAVASCKPSL